MDELANWCESRGISINEKQLGQMVAVSNHLLDWNQRMNLTAITDYEGIWQKHFADSLTLLPFLPPSQDGKFCMIDVGTGAGFPGIPLKIMRPDIEMILLDSLRKRVNFLESVVKLLELSDIKCIHSRAEDFNMIKDGRSKYAICTARAVARLDKLCKWCMPFLAPGGHFLAMKGRDVMDEVNDARGVIRKMGGEVVEVREVEIVPGLVHSVVVVCYTGERK